ncbi:MAG: hypothetical protein ACKVPJ_00940 [Chitinophagales bacterium]
MKKLVFVYNANADTKSTVSDFLHKIFSPETYPCQLCAITFNTFSMKKEWETFIKELPIASEFLHKDEFEKKFPTIKIDLPAVLLEDKGSVNVYISATELNAMILQQLIQRVGELASGA